MRPLRMFVGLLAVAAVAAACGDDGGSTGEVDSQHPYKPGETTVIGTGANGTGETPQEFANPAGAGCLKDDKGKCVDLSTACAPTDKVDVVVDKKGVVVSVICYPTGQAPVSSAESKPPTGRTYANNEVVVLDNVDDGADIKGDVDVDSNNVFIWGESPATSVIEGNVTISKNNGIVRGVRIKGNVTITGNNSAVLLSIIEGNVTITGNNNVLASCDVYGNVIVQGQNDAVVNNRIVGDVENSGSGLVCDSNIGLVDKDSDKTFDEGEAGSPIDCGGGSGGSGGKNKLVAANAAGGRGRGPEAPLPRAGEAGSCGGPCLLAPGWRSRAGGGGLGGEGPGSDRGLWWG